MTGFVSYSSDDRVEALVTALRRHGLPTWWDRTSLGSGTPTHAAIDAVLSQCEAALLWIGGNTLASSYVQTIEIPAIFKAHLERGMRIVPLFVDLGASDGIDAVRAATGEEIGDYNGHVLNADEALDEFLASIAEAEARARLDARADERRPVVRMVTRSDVAPGRDVADLNFDWIAEYPSDGRLPDDATEMTLREALHRSTQQLLGVFGAGPVDLHLSCHLHLGVALGYELRSVTRMVPRISVGDGWWACSPATGGGDAPLREATTAGPAAATRCAVELYLSRDIAASVTAHVAATDTRYRERIRLVPPGGPAHDAVESGNLNQWAEQAAAAIRRARATPGVDGVDLFIAAPIGFAVALGWRLNAIADVRLFHQGNSGFYRQVWTLPAA